MKVVPVPYGSKGVDCDTKLTAETASALRGKGIDFVVRYLAALSSIEIADILGGGLGLELVTFSRAPGWLPTAAMGTADGRTDVLQLKALGVPEGMVVFIDLEGSGGNAADTFAWVEARAKELVTAGYLAGLYVGSGCVLDGAQLYAIPSVSRYWRAFNSEIPEPKCGWCQFQTFPPNQTLAGVLVDLDFSQGDYESRVPTMLVSD